MCSLNDFYLFLNLRLRWRLEGVSIALPMLLANMTLETVSICSISYKIACGVRYHSTASPCCTHACAFLIECIFSQADHLLYI